MKRILFLAVSIAVSGLCLGAPGGGSPSAVPRQPSNPAVKPVPKIEDDPYDWYGRHDHIVRDARKMAHTYVLIGDSITHYWSGWPVKNHQEAGPIGGDDQGLNPAFVETFGGKAVGMGFGYDRTQNMIWRVQNGELDGLKPKYVIVMAGTNNQTTSKNFPVASTADELFGGIQALVVAIKKKVPKATIVVMGILPRTDVPDAKAQAVNAKLATAFKGKKGLLFIDMWDDFANRRFRQPQSLYSDRVHLNAEGYRVWAEALKKAGVL